MKFKYFYVPQMYNNIYNVCNQSLLIHTLISRAVLFHFLKVCPRSSEEQNAQDVQLDKAMSEAHGAAGEIISLGKIMSLCRQQFVAEILPQVQATLPHAIHRVQHSYGLTVFAALKVCVQFLAQLHCCKKGNH